MLSLYYMLPFVCSCLEPCSADLSPGGHSGEEWNEKKADSQGQDEVFSTTFLRSHTVKQREYFQRTPSLSGVGRASCILEARGCQPVFGKTSECFSAGFECSRFTKLLDPQRSLDVEPELHGL